MNARYQRQSFLGENSEEIFGRAVMGAVGLGGGGSHIVQQMAHLGFRRYVYYDPQTAEDTNLNRLVGATTKDVGRAKIQIARRVILGLQQSAEISAHLQRWQVNPDPLKTCDIVVGCVDSFKERDELETFCRRHLIVYIDIGMDIHQVEGELPRMAGQIILSAPGYPCMKCLGFINEAKLAMEAAKYGAAGSRPQVIWANGVLASTAVGLAVDVLTNWTGHARAAVYLSYDGNLGFVTEHPRLHFAPSVCEHYRIEDAGEPRVLIL